MICYFIYSGKFNSKVGGHFQSVKSIATAISSEKDVQVIVLGHSLVDIYKEAGLPAIFFKISLFNFPLAIYRIIKHIKKVNASNLHAFDSFAYFIVRIVSFITAVPSFLTKCGGPNFSHLAVSKNTIFFSKENYNFYSGLKKFNRVDKYLIPNRVFAPKINHERIASTVIDDGFTGIKFLRVNRIGVYYKKTMMNAINLVTYLNDIGIKSRLYIVGYVTEPQILEEIVKHQHVTVLTEEKYYLNASELIPLFDCVIGTGRSAMEAFSYGKIVMAPVLNCDLPVLVNKNNIQYFIDVNFSERIVYPELDVEIYKKELLNFDWKSNISNNDSITLFEEYFDVKAKISLYISLYDQKAPKEMFIKDFLFHLMIFYSKLSLDVLRSAFPRMEVFFAKKIKSIITNKA